MATDYKQQLSQKERELELTLALDEIRDSIDDQADQHGLFRRIITLLKTQFRADAAAIAIVAEDGDDIDSFIALDLTGDEGRSLCLAAMSKQGVNNIESEHWAHVMGVQVILDKRPLGGVVIARKHEPFSKDEMNLLRIAERQIDSAVIQARTVWKLMRRNRKLEAIYRIDHLRDETSDEKELIGAFTIILVDQFEAEVCLVILAHAESQELVISGIVDKRNLNMAALDSIRAVVGEITKPQIIPTPENIDDLVLLAAPFIVAETRLGAVVVGRKSEFDPGDHRLLYALTSQMDWAIVQSRATQQLTQRNRELEIIYHIDRIRDQEDDFDTMIQRVLGELCNAIAGEIGFIMLYNESDEQKLELRATTSDSGITSPEYHQVINDIATKALTTGRLVYENNLNGAVRSSVAIPLILNERVIGVFGAINSANPGGFTGEDRRMLTAITSQVDTAIFERIEQRRIRRVLSRSVGASVLDYLLEKGDATLFSGERVVLSILRADLRGSTEWAERTDPEELVETLNLFLGHMTDVIYEYGGAIDKFIGDEIVALFGTPIDQSDHALRAVRTAAAMQNLMQTLQAEMTERGRELPSMGIGISSGEALVGEFGNSLRTDFTAMGRVMNRSARICNLAEAGQIMISQKTFEMVAGNVTVNPLEPVTMKGIDQPELVYELLTVAGLR